MRTGIVFVSKDVFFWPIIQKAAKDLQSQLLIVRGIDDQKLSDLNPDEVACFLIDLSSVEVAQIESTVKWAREQFGSEIRCIAFGPHVQEKRLVAAQQAGCDPVLTKGQFVSKIVDLLKQCLP